eukprot:3400875-Heterocapsa_arctica.AAC.1
MATPAHEAKLWSAIEKHITFSDPALPIDRYLGAHYVTETFKDQEGFAWVRFSVDMSEFRNSACKVYESDIQTIVGASHL